MSKILDNKFVKILLTILKIIISAKIKNARYNLKEYY